MSGQRDGAGAIGQLVDIADFGLAITNVDRFTYVNDSFATLHGWDSPDELVDRPWREIYPDSISDTVQHEVISASDTGDRWEGTVEFDASDGSNGTLRLIVSRMADGRFAWQAIDASEIQDTRVQLHRYESILKNIRDAVYTLDSGGRITWVNETAIDAFDGSFDRSDLIGAPVSKVMDDEDIQRCVELIHGLMTNNHDSARCEVDLIDRDGRTVPVELHLTLLPSEDGSFQGTIGVARDVSDRKRREQRLSVLNRVLRHNVRNDVNVITGLAADLARRSDGPEREALERIRERGEQLVALSEKARSVQSSIDADDDARPVDIVPIVESACDDYSERFPAAHIDYSVPEDAWVAADSSMTTVVANLIENAIRHNESPSPTVVVRVRDDANVNGKSDCVELTVADDGPGIPEAELAVLENETETPLKHGSGIGLWVVSWIVANADGELRFDRSDLGGAAVTVILDGARAPG